MVERVCEEMGVSQRRACQVLTQPRATQRYILQRDLERESLVERIVALATRYGRYGYRRVEGEPQKGGTDMEAGGVEGTQQTAQER